MFCDCFEIPTLVFQPKWFKSDTNVQKVNVVLYPKEEGFKHLKCTFLTLGTSLGGWAPPVNDFFSKDFEFLHEIKYNSVHKFFD